jgi:hypothetical protein
VVRFDSLSILFLTTNVIDSETPKRLPVKKMPLREQLLSKRWYL